MCWPRRGFNALGSGAKGQRRLRCQGDIDPIQERLIQGRAGSQATPPDDSFPTGRTASADADRIQARSAQDHLHGTAL